MYSISVINTKSANDGRFGAGIVANAASTAGQLPVQAKAIRQIMVTASESRILKLIVIVYCNRFSFLKMFSLPVANVCTVAPSSAVFNTHFAK